MYFADEPRYFDDFSPREIVEIANAYADKENMYSMGYYAREYHTTNSVIKHVLSFVISKAMVKREVAYRIAEKATKNAGDHGGGMKTFFYYQGLLKEFERAIAEREGTVVHAPEPAPAPAPVPTPSSEPTPDDYQGTQLTLF